MDEKAAIELARSYARNCNIVEHAAHKYLQNVDAKWQPHEWVVRAILAAHRQGTQAAAPTRVLTEHSGCGQGAQVDQLSVTLHPGDRVLLELGKYSAAIEKDRASRHAASAPWIG